MSSAASATAVPPRARTRTAGWHFTWFAGISLLAFLLPFVLTSVWRLQHDVYYLIYFTVTLAALSAYVRRTSVNLREWLRTRWFASLVLGLAATAFVVWSVFARIDATPRPGGWYLAFEVIWRGVAYGVVDALLLSAFPALVALGFMRGRVRGVSRRIAYGALTLALVTAITVTYHIGYDDFRNREVVGPVVGNTVISMPVIATANPLGSVIAHAAMHLAAVTHAYESSERLPPQASAGVRR